MCKAPDIPTPAPAPTPPPTLEQLAPKSASGESGRDRTRLGLSRYKIGKGSTASSTQLGGIPTKTGV